MGRGTRHSKNAGGYGSEGLTYHEKQALRHGTIQERLGKVGICLVSGQDVSVILGQGESDERAVSSYRMR